VRHNGGGSAMSGITTHVLDLTSGAPAFGLRVRLERGDSGTIVAEQTTDEDGRARGFGSQGIEAIRYRLVFDTGAYWRSRGVQSFFPVTTIEFDVADPASHYHVPLLMSPFGYSTYRGS
ncbi:MAG: hydroxyisourate hydrolase, partial [Gemmatimonadaceae bacterium]